MNKARKILTVLLFGLLWFAVLPFPFTNNEATVTQWKMFDGVHLANTLFSSDTVGNYFANANYRVASMWNVVASLAVSFLLGYGSYRLLRQVRGKHARRR